MANRAIDEAIRQWYVRPRACVDTANGQL